MSCPINKEALDRLRQFIDVCRRNPDVLSLPDLSFFKDFIESLGGKIPTTPKKMHAEEPPTGAPQAADDKVDEEESEPESDLELDTEGCVDADILSDSQKMGDPAKVEISEEDIDKSNEKRSEAIAAFSEGNFEQAVNLFTEAIELNPQSGLLFAKRGQAYLKLNKPNACIKDCTRALELNPDSAGGYKFRGRAHRLLGEWEKAAKDLRQACNIDMDEQVDEWLKEVTPNAKKIEQHLLKQERKKLDKLDRERRQRQERAREAHARASATAGANQPPTAPPGGGAAGPKPDDFYKLLQDPEMMAAFTDPEVSAAFADITSNPANFHKYQSNPKVMELIKKLSGKLAGAGMTPGGGLPGFPGGMPGFGGFPGFGGAPGAEAEGPGAGAPPFGSPDDDNLD